MSLNLHAAVRSVIPAINADIAGWWYVNKGASIGTDGRQVATFQVPVSVQLQVQPPSAKDLRFAEFLQLQGVVRTVFMFSNPQGIVRVNQTGNDLLLFPQWAGTPNDAWLVAKPDEGWNVDYGGWTKLIAVLQTDRLYSVLNPQGQLTLDAQGRIVRNA
jgi:hypothetical protein